MFQKAAGYILLTIGILFGIFILVKAAGSREEVRKEAGDIRLIGFIEVLIYFIATLGLSDFLMHTLEIRGLKLADDRRIPGTLLAAAVTPGAVMACYLLQSGKPAGAVTIVLCTAALLTGGVTGGMIIGRIDGSRIKKFMGIALIGSLAALILKMIVSGSAAGTLLELTGWRLVLAVLFSFFWGNLNMLGVPMKPAGTAVFLLLGLSPVAVLTLTLVMGCAGPMGGAPVVVKRGDYLQKVTVMAVTAGSAGAVLGGLFAVSVDPVILNVLMMIMLVIAIISMLRPTAGSRK